MNGLIIKKKWLDLILSGDKTLEIRGSATKKIGEEIYLLESGSSLVRGKAVIKDIFPITCSDWSIYREEHQVLDMSYDELLKIYPNPYFWKIKVLEKYKNPMNYEHPKSAVIWVKDVENRFIYNEIPFQ